MSKRIAMFNHKGGVGKTLSAYHIGWSLTQRGKRVLLVDGDSQVNLTAISLGTDVFDTYYDSEPTKGRNIKDGVSPAFEGKPVSIDGFECPNALGNDQLFVLPGHPDLSTFEGQLSLAQDTGGTLSVLKNLPGALNHLMSKIEDIHSIDYTIIDLNPGLGALNQNLFLTANAFIVPTNPDPFSKMAIGTLAERVVKWNSWKIGAVPVYKDAIYPLSEGGTKFIGIITSRFNKHSSKAAKRFDERIKDIDDTVEGTLIPKIAPLGMALEEEKYKTVFQSDLKMGPGSPTSRYSLARIPDFQSLAQIASQFEVPVFGVTDAMMKEVDLRGNALDAMRSNREQFGHIFKCISEKVEVLMDG